MTLFDFIWRFIRKQIWLFGIGLILSLTWTFDILIWPYFLRKTVDLLSLYDGNRLAVWPSLKPLLLLGAALWIFVEFAFRLRDFLLARAFPKFEAEIRQAMFAHVQRHSPKYFNEHFSGSLANKIGDMVLTASTMVRSVIMMFIPAFCSCLATVIIFSQVSPIFALVVAVWLAIHLTISWFFTLKCSHYSYLHGEARSNLVGKVVDSLTNNFVVNLFFRFRYEDEQIARSQKEEQKANYEAQLYNVKMFGALSCVFIFEIFFLTYFMISYWMEGAITTGEIVQLFYTMLNLSMVMWHLSDQAPEFFRSAGIARQALTIMNDPQDLNDVPHALNLSVKKGEIKFDDVFFGYGAKEIFQGKNLHIKAGEKVGLVGYSGAGKSTFVNLILRFFPLEKGRILIDGQDIAHVTLESLREQIALIPQDPILFHRTLADNIRYGQTNADQDEIAAAAKLAHCDEFIKKCSKGYQTLVGERGTKLSGGEKQRIVIARAMLLKAPILLLDEATSALDSVTENYIQDSLDNLMKNRTTVVIAHRLSTLSKMDRILVFDHGKIIEEGTHASLLAQNGHYAHMWHMQAGGFLPNAPA